MMQIVLPVSVSATVFLGEEEMESEWCICRI